MGVLVRQQNGTEASVCCTNYKLDGMFVENVRKDFGAHSKQAFKVVQSSIANTTVAPGLNLDPGVAAKLAEFVKALNQYKNSLDFENKPEDIYSYTAALALYDLTEAFMKSDASAAEKLAIISANQNSTAALFEITTKGVLNVSTSLVPFINDARDIYELVNGRDLFTGEEIDGFGRVVTAVALVAGNGNLYRKAVDKLKESFLKKAVTESLPGIPKLTYTGNGSWLSEAGLIYRRSTDKYENNLRHILRHCTPDASKPNHTVFSISAKEVPKLIDEAWTKGGAVIADPAVDVYLVTMGRTVGTKGEKSIRLVFKKGTKEIITAYPQ
jgi:hypothetical protein